jgi:hypothetical protein
MSGTGPSAVTGQTGELQRVVDWVATAYEDIQNLHKTWRFLRSEFSFSTIVGTQEYTPAAVSLADLALWHREDMRVYDDASDEYFLQYFPWDQFRISYKYGSNRTVQSRPTICTITPDNSIALWQIPDAIYTIDGQYYKSVDTFTANADVPNFDSRYHMIIVWRALMLYGAYEAAEERYSHGQNEYRRLKRKMEIEQLPDRTYAEPLA